MQNYVYGDDVWVNKVRQQLKTIEKEAATVIQYVHLLRDGESSKMLATSAEEDANRGIFRMERLRKTWLLLDQATRSNSINIWDNLIQQSNYTFPFIKEWVRDCPSHASAFASIRWKFHQKTRPTGEQMLIEHGK